MYLSDFIHFSRSIIFKVIEVYRKVDEWAKK